MTADEIALAREMNKAVVKRVRTIQRGNQTKDQKLQALDELSLAVLRNHPDGWAAGALKVISQAETEIMYPGWKG